MSARRVHRNPASPGSVRLQRGVVMWVALGVLIIMSLAGLAMLRQMGGGVSIAGNVAFKQGTTAAADLGTEAGRFWLMNYVDRDHSAPALGYSANWGTSTDPTTFDWTKAQTPPDAPPGNTVKFVIHRMCKTDGAALDPLMVCSKGGRPPINKSGTPSFPGTVSPFYRITTQVSGPRNTVSYIQVITN